MYGLPNEKIRSNFFYLFNIVMNALSGVSTYINNLRMSLGVRNFHRSRRKFRFRENETF